MKNILTKTVFGDTLNKTMTLNESLTLLKSSNLLNEGELAEQAVSIKSKITRCKRNKKGYDLVNGAEIKFSNTNIQSNGNLVAYVTKKHNNGTIFSIINETLTKKQYFFVFPEEIYTKVKGSTFSPSFHRNGLPRRDTIGAINWWEYEVKSFAVLCRLARKYKKPEIT